jgi:hypothetical protein
VDDDSRSFPHAAIELSDLRRPSLRKRDISIYPSLRVLRYFPPLFSLLSTILSVQGLSCGLTEPSKELKEGLSQSFVADPLLVSGDIEEEQDIPSLHPYGFLVAAGPRDPRFGLISSRCDHSCPGGRMSDNPLIVYDLDLVPLEKNLESVLEFPVVDTVGEGA